MKQILTILLTTCITLAIFALVPSCRKSVDIGAERNKVLFWCSSTQVGDSITVTLSNNAGSAVSYITSPRVAEDCDAQGVARFSTKAWNYDYTAVSTYGWTWQGHIEAKDVCNSYELKIAAATVPDYRIAFWSREGANGQIRVSVDGGQPLAINTGMEARDCSSIYAAVFAVAPGVHRFEAVSAGGRTWADTVLAGRPCRVYELKP